MRITKATLLFLCAIIVVVLLLPIDSAQADQEATPFDYSIITADKEYIFVMFVPDEEIMQAWEFLGEEPTFYKTRGYNIEITMDGYWGDKLREKFSLRTKYPCSGLYKNDGSTIPLWTVDWYGFVYLLDHEHLIRQGPWNRAVIPPGGTSYFDGLAVAFYKNGYQLANYSVNDLVKDIEVIQFSVSHYEWREEEEFDRDSGLLFIETVDHQKYTFDIRAMGKDVEEKNVNCISNYRFGKTGPFTAPPKNVLRTEEDQLPEQNKNSSILIAVIAFILVIGSARFVDVVQKHRK